MHKIVEIELTAESFLYKMIRKLVGICVMTGKYQFDLNMIEKMFACPPDYYDLANTNILAPYGLVLKNVNHSSKNMDYTDDDYRDYLKNK